MSPGYAYERAPDRSHFLNRTKTKKLFRDVFALGKGKKWNFMHSGLFLDFLAGNSGIRVHAVGHAGPQHLRLAEALLFAWRRLHQDLQGADGHHRLGNLRHRQVRKVRRLHGALRLRADRGQCGPHQPAEGNVGGTARVKTTGPMAPEIDLTKQRPAQYIFSAEVQKRLSEIRPTRPPLRGPSSRQKRPPPPKRNGAKICGPGSGEPGPFLRVSQTSKDRALIRRDPGSWIMMR